MVSRKDEAERLRLGIRGGWLKISDVVAWADEAIAQSSESEVALLDLALLTADRNRDDVARLLEAVSGTSAPVAVMRRCLGDLLKAVEREPQFARNAVRWLEDTAIEGGLPESEFGDEPRALDDAFGLAESGTFGTVDEVRERLLEFLREQEWREA